MMDGVQAALLPDGKRLHLQQGPIDLIVSADGDPIAVDAAFRAAACRFASVLGELCDELPQLRLPADQLRAPLDGPVARRMQSAVQPFAADCFITPMAAVAGAVADEILATVLAAAPLCRAAVNNGGDIALFLAPGQSFAVGIVDRVAAPRLAGVAQIGSDSGIGGVATSGCGGRSFSLGIADAVTILAATAAAADAAATVVANRVDLPDHPLVERMAANRLAPDSDLGDRPVTVAVGRLAPSEIERALASGWRLAEDLLRQRRIAGAALFLHGQCRQTDRLCLDPAATPVKGFPVRRSA